MDCIGTKIKPKTDSRKYKDWERHARVITLLQRKHKTITQMAIAIDEYVPLVSACIWGIPGRQNPRIEEKIARFLSVTRAELFGEAA
jgi:tRNA U34 5-carboxymethylaminomethyl modifying enzyme MnmG/GidA